MGASYLSVGGPGASGGALRVAVHIHIGGHAAAGVIMALEREAEIPQVPSQWV